LKCFRREMEARVGRKMSHAYGVPWAAETGRLGSSVGRDLSTEVLPAPASGAPRSARRGDEQSPHHQGKGGE
jgi:hypothetical protein